MADAIFVFERFEWKKESLEESYESNDFMKYIFFFFPILTHFSKILVSSASPNICLVLLFFMILSKIKKRCLIRFHELIGIEKGSI